MNLKSFRTLRFFCKRHIYTEPASFSPVRKNKQRFHLFSCQSSLQNVEEWEEVHACQVASVVSASLQPHGLQPFRLLCPWDSPGKNTGMGCHALLQGIFLTQELNLCLLCLLALEEGFLTTSATWEEVHGPMIFIHSKRFMVLWYLSILKTHKPQRETVQSRTREQQAPENERKFAQPAPLPQSVTMLLPKESTDPSLSATQWPLVSMQRLPFTVLLYKGL